MKKSKDSVKKTSSCTKKQREWRDGYGQYTLIPDRAKRTEYLKRANELYKDVVNGTTW